MMPPAIGNAQQTTVVPWSGYWWPTINGGLATGSDYRGHPAPLEKYEMFIQGSARGDAVNWYLNWKAYYDPSAESWNGLCPYWSRASMMENYDILPSSIDNIVFRVGDKKGLLTLCHDTDLMTIANGADPVNLHRWLLGYINDQNTPFTADLDPSSEVWYYPIYRYEMTSRTSGLIQSVSVRVYYATDDVLPDYMGIQERVKIYTYNLTLNSNGEIINGEWTGDSISDHPDTLSFPEISAGAKNPYLDCAKIRQIAQSTDDFLETPGNSAATITPGTYHLILANQDQYILEGKPGDEIFLEVNKDDTSDEDIQMDLSDASGKSLVSQTLKGGDSMTYDLAVTNPPYTITLTQADYSNPNIYTLTVDQASAFHQQVPYIPKNGPWCGFAITNGRDQVVENVMMVTRSNDGRPLQTVLGPLNLNPGEKRLFVFDDLPYRKHEYPDTKSIFLIADQPVGFVNLFAFDQKPMAGFVEGQSDGAHLVIADTSSEMPTDGRQMTGGILNESFTDAPVNFRVFSGDGEKVAEFSQTIPADGRIDIQPGNNPFYNMPDGGWIDIVATGGNQLSAYQYVTHKAGKRNAIETLFAIPVGATTKFVPHITPVLGWWTTYLTLINPSENPNTVNFHYVKAGSSRKEDVNLELGPYEKRVMDLSSEFGKLEGEALYRSVLEITGQYPIVGYYTYSPPYGGDEASYPLLDSKEFNNELLLPHYAGSGGAFWTGVCVCNPSGDSINVVMEPVDNSEKIISDGVKTVSLGPGAYDVFTVDQRFGEAASKISFIKFHSTNGSAIGGFYLYGNMKNGVPSVEMLSGANM